MMRPHVLGRVPVLSLGSPPCEVISLPPSRFRTGLGSCLGGTGPGDTQSPEQGLRVLTRAVCMVSFTIKHPRYFHWETIVLETLSLEAIHQPVL